MKALGDFAKEGTRVGVASFPLPCQTHLASDGNGVCCDLGRELSRMGRRELSFAEVASETPPSHCVCKEKKCWTLEDPGNLPLAARLQHVVLGKSLTQRRKIRR